MQLGCLGSATSAGAVVVLTPKWDQRFESGFLHQMSQVRTRCPDWPTRADQSSRCWPRSCVSSRSRKRHTPISHDCERPLDCSIALHKPIHIAATHELFNLGLVHALEYGVARADLKSSIPWARSRFLERKRLR